MEYLIPVIIHLFATLGLCLLGCLILPGWLVVPLQSPQHGFVHRWIIRSAPRNPSSSNPILLILVVSPPQISTTDPQRPTGLTPTCLDCKGVHHQSEPGSDPRLMEMLNTAPLWDVVSLPECHRSLSTCRLLGLWCAARRGNLTAVQASMLIQLPLIQSIP